jgi:hypothetical protein
MDEKEKRNRRCGPAGPIVLGCWVRKPTKPLGPAVMEKQSVVDVFIFLLIPDVYD